MGNAELLAHARKRQPRDQPPFFDQFDVTGTGKGQYFLAQDGFEAAFECCRRTIALEVNVADIEFDIAEGVESFVESREMGAVSYFGGNLRLPVQFLGSCRKQRKKDSACMRASSRSFG